MKPIPERVEEFKREFWKLSGDSVPELDRKQDEYVQNMLTETDQQAREEERKRIEAIFMEVVPPHALSLEDSVWLKRLLNKAFNHSK